MNLNFQQHIPNDFDDSSKVWIYQSDRIFSSEEIIVINKLLENFVSDWKSHGVPVKGYASLFFNQFIIFMADETATGVSGCSTDSSVHLIKEIEQKFKVDLFNRQNLAFIAKDKIQIITLSDVKNTLQDNSINANTLYFNNTILTKKEMLEKWIIPVKESWLNSRFQVK